MKKILLLVSFCFLAYIAYQFGYEARLFGTDYFFTGLKHDWQLGFLLGGMLCWICAAIYYSKNIDTGWIKNSFLLRHKNKLLIFAVFLISGVNVNSGFENNGPRIFNVKLYGAVADGIETNDGSISSSSQTLTCTTCGFTAAAVGKYIVIAKAGASSAPLYTTISAFTNSTTVTLTDAAGTTVSSGGNVIWGTENAAAIQAAVNAQFAAGLGKVYFPNGNGTGMYITGAALTANTPLGYAVNAQIYIPSNSVTGANSAQRTAVTLEGEAIGPLYTLPGPIAIGLFSKTGIILRSTISGSGILPAVIGFPNVPDGFEGVGSTDGYFKNILIKVYTNQGSTGPTMTGLNGNYASSVNIYNMGASIDVIPLLSQDPSGKEVAGFIIGRKNDNGPNIVDKCFSAGFKYGFVLGEHTIVNSLYSGNNYYGVCLPRADYGSSGFILLNWNRIPIYTPTASATNFLDGQSGAGQSNVSFHVEIEVLDTLSSTRWYGGKGQPRIADTSNFLHGAMIVTSEISGGAKDVPMLTQGVGNLLINYQQDNSNWVGGNSLLSFTSLGLRSYYASGFANLGIGSLRMQGFSLNAGIIGDNSHLNTAGTNFVYDSTGFASWLQFSNGNMAWRSGVSGSAGAAITTRTSFMLNNDLSFGIGGSGAFAAATGYFLNGSTAGIITPGTTNAQDFGSSTLTWRSGLFSGAESHGFVNVAGTGIYSALGTDYTIQFTGTTATLAYPTINLINGRHLNIINNASGSITIPSTKNGNASNITTLTTGQRAQVEYDLSNTTWTIVSLN